MKKSTRVILFAIIAVMLLSCAPLSAFAAAPAADETITVGVPKKVSLSKTNIERVYEFTAPETTDYVIWSESDKGDIELYVYKQDGTEYTRDERFGDFSCKTPVEAGKKYYLKVEGNNKTELINATIHVDIPVTPTGIELADDFANMMVGYNEYVDYRLIPGNAAAEVEIISSNPAVAYTDSEYAYFVGSGKTDITVKVKGTDISDSITVTVPSDPEIYLDKPVSKSISILDPENPDYVFTAPEAGEYTVYAKADSLITLEVDGSPVGTSMNKFVSSCVILNKGEKISLAVSPIMTISLNYELGVKKTTKSSGVTILSLTENYVAGVEIPVLIIPSDPAAKPESGYSFSVKDNKAEIVFTNDYDEHIVVFPKAGKYTLIAKGADSKKTATLEVDVKACGEVTLDKPYSGVFNKAPMQTSDFGSYVSFKAPEKGEYVISVAGEAGTRLTLAHSVLPFMPPDGEKELVLNLEKGEVRVFVIGNDPSNIFGEFDSVKSSFTVIAAKAVYTTEPNLPTSVDIHRGETLCIPVLPKVAGQVIKLAGVSVVEHKIGASVWKENIFVIHSLEEQATKATVNVRIEGRAEPFSMNVNVLPEKVLKEGKLYKKEKDLLIDLYHFTPEKSGFYYFESNGADMNVSDVLKDEYIGGVSSIYSLFTGGKMNSDIIYLEAGRTYSVSLGNIKKDASFIVKKAENATSVTCESGVIYVGVGMGTEIEQYLTFSPHGAICECVNKITFEDPTVAKFEKGMVYGLKEGRTKAHIVTDYGLKTTVEIVSKKEVPSFTEAIRFELDKNSISLKAGESEVISTNTKRKIEWRSSDTSVATVDANGKVTAKKAGKATIYANFYNIIKKCEVTVTGPVIKDTSKIFKDVVKGQWYQDAIDYNYAYKFIVGISENEFGVDKDVTRGQFITILARMAGVNTDSNNVKTKFTDVKSGKYYAAAIKWASENGIVAGVGNNKFKPEKPIERQQLCVMLVNFAKHQGIKITATEKAFSFADSKTIGSYAKTAVTTCQRADIINGYNEGGKLLFKPTANASRAEAAQILYKFHKDIMSK